MNRGKESRAENTAHLKITSAVLVETNCTPIVILDIKNFQNIQNIHRLCVLLLRREIFKSKIITQTLIYRTFRKRHFDILLTSYPVECTKQQELRLELNIIIQNYNIKIRINFLLSYSVNKKILHAKNS